MKKLLLIMFAVMAFTAQTSAQSVCKTELTMDSVKML